MAASLPTSFNNNQNPDYISALQPLDGFRDQIRLVIVHAAREMDAPIVCTILVASLQDKPTHATLSYVWGDPNKTSPILINGLEHRVTMDLKAALQQLRTNRATEKPIWIDALCINQKDVDERNVQITYMPKIYEMAYLTFVWLGKGKGTSSMAMDNVSLLGDLYMKWEINYSIVDEERFQDILTEADSRREFNLWNEENIGAFYDLFQRPWWQRRWIIQEAALSERILVVCGNKTVPWQHFVATSLFLTWIRKQWAQPTSQFHRSHIAGLLLHNQKNCLRVQVLRNGRPYSSVLELLGKCRSSHESDPRDAIYALLSLTSDLSLITPDYRKTTRQVYLNFALNELFRSQSLRILHHCFYRRSVDDAVPSWVPDWRVKHSWKLPAHFNATGNTTASFTVSENSSILQVRGVIFGEIRKQCHVPSAYSDSSANQDWMELILNRDGFFNKSEKWIYSILRAIKLDQSPTRKALGHDSVPDVDMVAGFLDFIERNHKITIDMVWEGIKNAERNPENIGDLSTAYQTLSTHANKFSFLESLNKIHGRKIIRTGNGSLGVSSPDVMQQDLICLIAGCQTPFVIRKVEHGYLLIGQCFVLDAMNGELLDDIARGNLQWEQLNIV